MSALHTSPAGHRWDIIVVGAGGSGLAAAVSSARNGARTLVLEKGAEVGGSTSIAVGSISAPNTRLQRRIDVVDSVDAFVEDSLAFTEGLRPRDNAEMRTRLVSEASDTVRFLEDLGISFVGPFLEPPHRVPRMLNAVPGARAYISALLHEVERLGVEVRVGRQVVALASDGSGRIVGVRAQGPHGPEELWATNGVVLAAGDYSAGSDLLGEHVGEHARQIGAVNPLSTGDGHRLGAEAGGELVNMDLTDGPQLRFPPPDSPTLIERLPSNPRLGKVMALIGNRLPLTVLRRFAKQLLTAWMAPAAGFIETGPVLVDSDGDRVEDAGAGLAYSVAQTSTGRSYLILSQLVASESEANGQYISTAPGIAYAYWSDYRRGRRDLIRSASTLAELAEDLGMDPVRLGRAIRESGSGDRFASGPYFSLGPVEPRFVITEGGLRVDHECRVLSADGSRVPGLWACGSNGQSGLVLSGHGLHILWAITSGRIAGRSAASDRSRKVHPHD